MFQTPIEDEEAVSGGEQEVGRVLPVEEIEEGGEKEEDVEELTRGGVTHVIPVVFSSSLLSETWLHSMWLQGEVPVSCSGQ